MSGKKILEKRIGEFNNKFTQDSVDGGDESTIFLNTASAPNLGIRSRIAPNAGLAIAAGILPVDKEFDCDFEQDSFEEYLAEVGNAVRMDLRTVDRFLSIQRDHCPRKCEAVI